MKQIKTRLRRLGRNHKGVTVVEYAMILALIIAGLIIIIAIIGGKVQKGLADFSNKYETAKPES